MSQIIDINTLFGPLPSASSDLTADALLTLMQKHNVGAASTLSTLGLLLDPVIGNAATRAACSEIPSLFPAATLNPTMFLGDAAPVLKLAEEGYCMVRFFPYTQGWPLQYAPFHDLLSVVSRTGLPVMIEVYKPGEITSLLEPLANSQTPVILASADVSLLAEIISALRRCPNWYVETSRLLASGAIQTLAGAVGPERILFGTGAPSRPVASALQTINYSGLPSDACQLILSGNAQRIMKIRL